MNNRRTLNPSNHPWQAGLFSFVIIVTIIFILPQAASAFQPPYRRLADYDSLWQKITPGTPLTLNHNLGGDPAKYIVDLTMRRSGYKSWTRSNIFGLGGDTWYDKGELTLKVTGCAWAKLSDTSIEIVPYSNETISDHVRVRIWKECAADWDSGWVDLAAGGNKTLNHNLGGDESDYIVELKFWDTNFTNSQGFHNIGIGGDETSLSGGGTAQSGAYWHDLDSASIQLTRQASDTIINKVRARIWVSPNPDIDSGWGTWTSGISTSFSYDAVGPFADLVVVPEFRYGGAASKPTNKGLGGDSWNRGGMGSAETYGIYWSYLYSTYCTMVTGISVQQEEYRVRIYECTSPRFDSGWRDLQAGGGETLNHDVGGDVEHYWVDFQVRENLPFSFWGLTNWGTGGDMYRDVLGSQLSQRGAGWYDLTPSKVEVLRFLNDTTANQYRLRIWLAGLSKFSTGDTPLTQGQTYEIKNPLLVDTEPDLWLVALQTKDTDAGGKGINNFFNAGDNYEESAATKHQGAAIDNIGKTVGGDKVARVIRYANDAYSDSINVRIWSKSGEDYLQNFVPLPKTTLTAYFHNLGWNAESYVVDVRGKVSGAQQHYIGTGGDFVSVDDSDPSKSIVGGVYWFLLNPLSVSLWREVNDGTSQEASIRIWATGPVGPDDIAGHITGSTSFGAGTRMIKEADQDGDSKINVGDVIQNIQSGYK